MRALSIKSLKDLFGNHLLYILLSYNIMLSCWSADPQERPSFSKLAERMGIMLMPDLKGVSDNYL